jgi:type I restriction enzyme, S subunit
MKTGWEVKTLDQISENLDSKRVPVTKNVRNSGHYPYYGASGIVDYVADYIFDDNLLLVSEDGANLLARTYPIAFSISGKSWVNNHAHILRFDNLVSQRFVEYYLNSIILDDYVSGMAQPKLNQKMLNSIIVPYPSFLIQQRIVAILDEAFAFIAKAKENAEKNLANAREVFESYLQNVFANRGEGWEDKTLGKIAKVIGGYSFKSSDFKKQGAYQVIRMGNVRNGIIRKQESQVFIDHPGANVLQKALIQPNDIIITQTGTKNKRDYGFTVIIEDDKYLLNQRIAAIRFSDNYLAKFFLYFSWTNFFRDQFFANETGTVGQGNVSIGAITEARIPSPPISVQQSIVSTLDTLATETRKLETIYKQKIADLDELKKSILEKAFQGEL